MRRLLAGIMLTVASSCISAASAAQEVVPSSDTRAQAALRGADTSQTYFVKLRDGSSFMGRVSQLRNDTISFSTKVGVVTLALADVKAATLVRERDVRAGEYWFPNPNTTRLLFAPTGRMLDRGNGYFSDYMLFFPGVAVGVTSNFTIGGGVSVFPGVSPAEQLFYLTPKVGLVASEKFNAAIGALALNIPSLDGGSGGIVYGVSTFGDELASVTLGMGFGYTRDQFADSPALMFGGDLRASPRVAFVSENYLFPDEFDGMLGSLGMRFLGEKMAFDFGFLFPLGAGETWAFPFIGFVSNF